MLIKRALDEAALAEVAEAIAADPTPHIPTPPPCTYERRLELNKNWRDRKRDQGGLSTTITFTPAGWKAVQKLRATFNEVNTNSEAVDMALLWCSSVLESTRENTLHIRVPNT